MSREGEKCVTCGKVMRPGEGRYSRYDTEKNEKHHADRFWALALAVHAAGIARGRKRKRRVVSASIV